MATTQTAQDIKLKLRTGDVLIQENIDFRGLLLSDPVQQGITKCGFERPSPIQLKAIPLGRCGLDLIIQAKSGTGKTCVFSVIALESLILDSTATQVLVLAPTREIAVQICEVISSIGSCMPGLNCSTFIGGTPLVEDRQKLAQCHIAVGSPGRIKQLIEEKILITSNIRLFVLDEADKLLEDSFQDQINWIFSALPENKQMLALSATYPEVLAQHLTAYMRNPTFLRLNVTDPALLGIRQYYKQVEFHPLPNKMFDRKTDALLELLSTVEFHQCLIFSNYQMRAESLSEVLNFRGWPATYISGSREQQDRMAAMASLKQMTCRVLISTDLTSRGIDAENVNLVINLDLPPSHETYLHRIGRAGRFGTYGAGVSFVATGKETDELRRLEKACNTTINPLPDPVPVDLARSSGYVSLDHLVTSETIVTNKDAVQPQPSKTPLPHLSSSEPDIKDDSLGDDNSEKSSEIVNQAISKSNKIDTTRTSELKLPNGSNEKTPKIDGKTKLTDESSKLEMAGKSDHSSSGLQTDDKPKERPKWKQNNVWTNLSFSYGAECKEIEIQKKKGKLQNAGPGDQRRNERKTVNTNHSRSMVKKTEGNTEGSVDGVGKVSCVTGDLKTSEAGRSRSNADSSTQVAIGKKPNIIMPSLKTVQRSVKKLRPFSEILKDCEQYEGSENPPSQVVDTPEEMHESLVKYVDYLENVSSLLKNISQKQIKSIETEKDKEAVGSAGIEMCKHSQPQKAAKGSSAEPIPKGTVLSALPSEEEQRNTAAISNQKAEESKISEVEAAQPRKAKNTALGPTVPGKDGLSTSIRLPEVLKNTTQKPESAKEPNIANTKPCQQSALKMSYTKTTEKETEEGTYQEVTTTGICGKNKTEKKSKKVPSHGRMLMGTGLILEQLTNYQTLNENNDNAESSSERAGCYDAGNGMSNMNSTVKTLKQSDKLKQKEITSNVPEAPTSYTEYPTVKTKDISAKALNITATKNAMSDTKSSDKPQISSCGKPRKAVGPYGPWEPYVRPEAQASTTDVSATSNGAQYTSTNITDDEAEESLTNLESDWESSSLSEIDTEETEDSTSDCHHTCHHHKPSYSKYWHRTPPPWGMQSPMDMAYQNLLTQQAMFFTNSCYQQYLMHLQYAEYYKNLLKTQQVPWDMETLYQNQKKYIRKMAKWMAKHNQK